jgi:hypothetical protein
MTDFENELFSARAVVDSLTADLGDAIANGRATKLIREKLKTAKEALADLEAGQQAVAAAQDRAAKRKAEEEEEKRQADIAARWQQAEIDHADIVATVNALQRNFDKQRELLHRLHHQSQAFADNHRRLGCNGNQMEALRASNWLGQMLLLLRETVPGMREKMAKVYLTGNPNAGLTAHVPSFDALFPKAPKKAIEYEEAA